jgi:aspartate racemase
MILPHKQTLASGEDEENTSTDSATAEVFVFPTTVAQRRFWLLDQLKPGNPAFNIPLAARLVGPLRFDLLEQAVNNVLYRHEILRTNFTVLEGELVQLIHPVQSMHLDRYDISGCPDGEREAQVTRLMLQEGERPFSLSKGLLLRGGLIKVHEEEHVMMLTMHHICADGWSNGVLLREVAQAYTNLVGGPELPELPLQYADFAQWQQEWLKSPAAEEQRKYWLERLQGAMPVLNQPTDRPRLANSNNPGTIHTLLLSKPLTEALKVICQGENITPFMLFFAVYVILLYRYTSNTDLIVGTPTANRGQTELEDLIGLFSNPLLLRADLSGNPTFRDLLGRVRGLAVEAFAHQSYPFELLAEEVKIDQARAGGQWIQAYFIYQKAFMVPQQMSEVTLTPLRSISPGATFEWSLGVLERTEGTRLQLEYNTDLFDEPTIDRFLRHFQQLLEGIPGCLDNRIDELPILTPPEEKLLLVDRNQSRVEFPSDRRVHEIFEEQVKKSPDALALEDGTLRVTYAELNRRANLMAHKLMALELGREKRVVLLAKRWSVEAAVEFLSILKAGACCVLIDAAWTPERISACIAGKELLVGFTREDLALKPLIEGLRWLDFKAEGMADGNPSSVAHLNQPACIRFTSDQAHPPNEAILSHRALLNGTLAIAREFGICEDDRIALGLMGLRGMEDLLAGLASGAAIVFNPPDPVDDGNLLQWLRKTRIAILSLPVARWQQVINALPLASHFPAGNLRLVVTGGGPLAKAPWMVWRERTGSKTRWLHRYSVCENAGPAAWVEPFENSNQNQDDGWRVTVGRPSANTQIYLLDDKLQPVPVGVMGRVFIGGDGLAKANTSVLDDISDCFVTDPFSRSMEARLLRADDFGRFLSNGQIELVARADELAQTRGWRLELREIQLVLMEHPGVWDVKLVLCDSVGLVAYIVSNHQPPPKGAEIVFFCRQRLPNYMVPAAVVVLAAFPLSPDGRLDFQALPVPDKEGAALDREYTPPRTDTERKLADIWAGLLHLERVGIRDSFFAMGGHSLLAARLFFRIELEFGRRLPLAALISRPTVEQLASLLENQSDPPSNWQSLISIQQEVSEPAFFCVHGAGGNILIYRELAKHLAPFVAFYGLQSQGLDRKSRCLTRIEDMAAHYVGEIKSVQPMGPYCIGGYCMGGQIAYEMARILRQQGHEVSLVAMLDSYNTQVIWEAKTLLRRLSILQQKFAFHSGNLSRLQFKEIIGYLYEKCRMAGELMRGKTVAALAVLQNRVMGRDCDPAVEDYIQEINHQALRDYRPGACEGQITLFKPERNYDSYSDPKMGWGNLALGGIEIVELPVNPHAMLVEPFVRLLAAELSKRIAPGRQAGRSITA